jgi:hypothetical protein
MLLDADDVGTGWQVGPAVTDAEFVQPLETAVAEL